MSFSGKSIWIILLLALAIVSRAVLAEDRAITAEMKADIDALVTAAKRLQRAWPWQEPLPEIDRVVRHGQPIAPALVSLLRYESTEQWGNASWDIHVEQQVELALCRLYGEVPESGKTVYSIRSFDKDNQRVKQFWQAKVRQTTN